MCYSCIVFIACRLCWLARPVAGRRMKLRVLMLTMALQACRCQCPGSSPSPESCHLWLKSNHQNNAEYYKTILGNIIGSLVWSDVTVIYDSHAQTAVDLDGLLHALHVKGVTTLLIDYSTLSTSVNMTSHNLLHDYITKDRTVSSKTDNFLLLGDFPFVLNVLHAMSSVVFSSTTVSTARPSGVHRYLSPLTTQWLVLTEADDTDQLNRRLAHWDHAVVIDTSHDQPLLWTLVRAGQTTWFNLLKSRCSGAFSYGRHELFPNLAQGLSNRTVRVVVKKVTYLLIKMDSVGKLVYKGVIIDLLNELSLLLNFSYTLQEPPDDSWGQRLPNGQWDGLIGMLTRKQADLALGPFRVTPNRTEVADATTFFDFSRTGLIFKTSDPTDDSDTFFIRPLQYEVYAAVGGSLVVVILLLLLARFVHLYVNGSWPTKPEVMHWVASDTEMAFSALLSKAHEWSLPLSRAGHVLIDSWLYVGLVVMGFCYSSQLTASLTVQEVPPPFKSLHDLVNQQTYTWGARGGTAVQSVLKASNIEVYRKFYHKAMQFSQSDPDVWSPFDDVHFKKLVSSKYVYLSGNEKIFHQMQSRACYLSFLDVPDFKAHTVLYLQKDSPYTQLFSQMISRIMEAGLVTHSLQKWRPAAKRCRPQENLSAITVERARTAFYLLGGGLALALTSFIVEIIIVFVNNRLPRQPDCVFQHSAIQLTNFSEDTSDRN